MSKFQPEMYVGLACQDVGAGAGGSVQMLARATVIDYWGNVLFDSFVQPTQEVKDYKTNLTGIEKQHVYGTEAVPFQQAQTTVEGLIRGRIIVGYSLWNDLAVLGISHLAVNTRDTALYMPFRKALRQPNQVPGLMTLVWSMMKRRIQSGFANSVEDARASMDLFRSVQDGWENYIFNEDWPCALAPATHAQYLH